MTKAMMASVALAALALAGCTSGGGGYGGKSAAPAIAHLFNTHHHLPHRQVAERLSQAAVMAHSAPAKAASLANGAAKHLRKTAHWQMVARSHWLSSRLSQSFNKL